MSKDRRGFSIAGAILMAITAVAFWLAALNGSGHAEPSFNGAYYVAPPPIGSDANSCLTGAPCATVQRAVDVAVAGHEIRVATGVYTGVHAREGMTQVVYISKTVIIRGGYSEDFATWDPDTLPTILDAQGEGRVVTIKGSSVDPTLEGFVITGGDATGVTANCPPAGAPSDGCGGGIFLHGANAVIVGNVISGNVAALATASHAASGGGICAYYAYGTVISDNLIIGNIASTGERGWGGGIRVEYAYGAQIISNRIINNMGTTHASLGGQGGGVYVGGSGSAVTMTMNLIEGNRTNSGSTGNGAGIYQWLGTGYLAGNRVIGNYGPQAVFLGGWSEFVEGRFEANQVLSNSTSVGVDVAYKTPVGLFLANNIIAGSGATAFRASATSGQVTTATLVHNTLSGSGTGYGVYVNTAGVALVFTNNIVSGYDLGITNTFPASSSVSVDHTLFWNNVQNGIEGTNSFAGDPAFVDPAANDYHIGPASAAIDVALDVGIAADVDGESRPIGSAPDIGADEAHKRVYLPLVLRSG